eukprot:NODE_7338_length_1588_cov_7.082136.p1 GENE.NODE_7338_length_1588_cov_7.082136~~NODE_7338_length_1588_cov_7.082136.p1  ORF type:complete len:288 (+),score=116.09 NODE_7338_length_1588_cov_7.082136:169-1032(+)
MAEADKAAAREDWPGRLACLTRGIDAIKRECDAKDDKFLERAAMLLSRRAHVHALLDMHFEALRDAIAVLDFVSGLPSARVVASEAAQKCGCEGQALLEKLLEPVGIGAIIDPEAPLMLRSVSRWLKGSLEALKAHGDKAKLPEPIHMEADRYLDGMDDDTRMQLIKRHMPEAAREFGGVAEISNAAQCLAIMNRWEPVLDGDDYSTKRVELWDKPLSNMDRIVAMQSLIADALKDILVPMGFAPGRAGLSACVKQMQQFWSTDLACARKAMDLEELADISLADLEI